MAGDPGSHGRGVLVVFNDEIDSARDVTKTSTSHLQAFESRGYGVLGHAARDRIVYYRRLERRHTVTSEFDVDRIPRLPRVDIVMAYQGASGDLIRAAVNRGAAGIVVAGAGSRSDQRRTGRRDRLCIRARRGGGDDVTYGPRAYRPAQRHAART